MVPRRVLLQHACYAPGLFAQARLLREFCVRVTSGWHGKFLESVLVSSSISCSKLRAQVDQVRARMLPLATAPVRTIGYRLGAVLGKLSCKSSQTSSTDAH